MIQFICGCESKLELPIPAVEFAETDDELESEKRKYLSTFDSIGHDERGFIVCAVHRERRKGWRSVPYQATKMPLPMAGWTPLEYERWLLFDEIPRQVISKAMYRSSAPDCRDNRDPQILGREILARSNGQV